VESADTEIEQGTGLGLAIVARIVRNMNGQLRAESEKGHGSKFTFAFTFPIPTSVQVSAFLEATMAAGTATDSTSMTYSTPPSSERPMSYRRHSNDSVNSRGSTHSGHSGRSEIDQLVGLIASPSLDELPRSSNGLTKRRSTSTSERGEVNVQDSGVPIRSVKIDEDDVDVPAANQFASNLSPAANLRPSVSFKPKQLRVLVAEDDPVNQTILKKRFSMDGHNVVITKDGAEVVEIYDQCWRECDIILMDLQVLASILFLTIDACTRRRIRC
jgi:hypothetical protein